MYAVRGGLELLEQSGDNDADSADLGGKQAHGSACDLVCCLQQTRGREAPSKIAVGGSKECRSSIHVDPTVTFASVRRTCSELPNAIRNLQVMKVRDLDRRPENS